MLDDVLRVRDGRFLAEDPQARLAAGPFPARRPEVNLADLEAQIASNETSRQELAAAGRGR